MSVSLEQLIKWRREFHQYPEIGWSEFLTTAKIVKVLRGLGLEVKVGPEVINQDFAFGRRRQVVEKGLAVARKHHVDEALLDEMQELTGCVAIFDSGKPGPTVALRF
ncbi:amidohydrolase, partial [Proteus mirabilis]